MATTRHDDHCAALAVAEAGDPEAASGGAEQDRLAGKQTEPDGRNYLPAPGRSAWEEAETRAAGLVRATTGNDPSGHLQAALKERPGAQVLALGATAGAAALELVPHVPGTALVCIDSVAAPLRAARQRARDLGVTAQFVELDLDDLELEPASFDLVFGHAVLHRVTALEALADQVWRALRPDGALLAVDVVTRNGYGMWPETHEVIAAIWQTLPARLRLNHTSYPVPLIDDRIWQPGPIAEGRNAPLQEDILPALESRFSADSFVPYFSLCRRFFDTMYGPNYDLAAPLDKAIFDWIWQLDVHYLASGRLRPETFFGIYRPQ